MSIFFWIGVVIGITMGSVIGIIIYAVIAARYTYPDMKGE